MGLVEITVEEILKFYYYDRGGSSKPVTLVHPVILYSTISSWHALSTMIDLTNLLLPTSQLGFARNKIVPIEKRLSNHVKLSDGPGNKQV